jgi:hypothetical protein
MRHAVGRIVRIVLCYYELAPPGDVSILQVALLAQYDAVVQRGVASQLGRFLEMGKTLVYRQLLAAVCAGLFLSYKGLVLSILIKFFGTHSYNPVINL